MNVTAPYCFSPPAVPVGSQRGLSLIELMMGLAIMALILFSGIPSFSGWIQNQQLRSNAEQLTSGLQLARAEAVKRNTPVEFVITDDDTAPSNVNSVDALVTGHSWVVRYLDTSITPNAYVFVQGHSGFENTGKKSTTAGAAPNVGVSGNVGSVTFNGFGRTSLGSQATFNMTNPTGGACAPTGAVRCLNVTVSTFGQIRMCDPAITAIGDSRAC